LEKQIKGIKKLTRAELEPMFYELRRMGYSHFDEESSEELTTRLGHRKSPFLRSIRLLLRSGGSSRDVSRTGKRLIIGL
jgi:hypothetical protein